MALNDKNNKMTDFDCLLWLSLKPNMNASKMERLLNRFGTPKKIFEMTKEEFLSVKVLDRKTVKALADKSTTRLTKIKDLCNAYGIYIITYDSEYYPENLRHISAPPYVLYIRSDKKINLNDYIRVGIVGNRRATEYGKSVAHSFGRDLAKNGMVVVSGMAEGVDAAAHRGAIEAGGITVAVMGCGLQRAYPNFHRELMAKIIETGVAISEYPPDVGVEKWHFPERNRIISGLSQGTLVVEAPERSGSLITANYAIDQGRELFAVPGDVNKERSVGTNNLLKECAVPVTSARDIFDYFSFEFSEIAKINERQKAKGIKEYIEEKPKNDDYSDLTEEEKHIITKITSDPVSFDGLLEATGVPADKLTSIITMLEIKGKITTHPGKKFTLNI